MNAGFYVSGIIAVIATIAAITRANAVHALLYFVVSLLAVGVIFFLLGAPFAAALLVIINAGAIMVLILFVIMMLDSRPGSAAGQPDYLSPRVWAGPVALGGVLIAELLYCLAFRGAGSGTGVIEPKDVSMALFGPYLIGVELISMLLLAGAVGAYHLGRGVSASKGGDK